MNRFDFSALVYDNIEIYILILLCFSFLYYKIFKPFFIFLLDPFLLSQFFSLFATTSVVFLYVKGVIDFYYFIQFFLTQIAFWTGLYYFNPKLLKNEVKKLACEKAAPLLSQKTKRQTVGLYIYFSLVFIVLQLFVYIKFGIPLFLPSRLSLFENSGGWGILGRILSVLNIIVLIGSFYVRMFYFRSKLLKKYSVFVIGFVIVTYILSGSKSTFIGLFSLYFLFLLIYNQYKFFNLRKFEKYLLVPVFIGAIFVISIQNVSESPLLLLIDRIVGSGDTFYQGYFSEMIRSIEGNALTLLFTDILGSYRIVDWNLLPRPIGMQLYSIIYDTDLSMGGNARHNYLGLICFGFVGSVLFSYFLGWLTSYIRNKLCFKFCFKGFLLGSFYILLLQGVIMCEMDFTMFVSSLNSLFLTYSFLIILFLGLVIPCFVLKKIYTSFLFVREYCTL